MNMKPTNETDVTAAREYWLYAWPEHHYIKGMPAEYSMHTIKILASDINEAAQRAHDAAPDAIKWELYLGSAWNGNAPLATYTKPPNKCSTAATTETRQCLECGATTGHKAWCSMRLLACPECHSPSIRVRLNFPAPDNQSMHCRIEIGCVNMRCKLYGQTFPESVWQRQSNEKGQA